MIDQGSFKSRQFYGGVPDGESDVSIEFAEATEDLSGEADFDKSPQSHAGELEHPQPGNGFVPELEQVAVAAPPVSSFARNAAPEESSRVRPSRGKRRAETPATDRIRPPAAKKSPRRTETLIEVEDDDDPAPLPVPQRLAEWIRSPESGSLVVSAFVHALLLIALSWIIISKMEDNQAISMTLSDDDGLAMELEEVMDLSVEMEGGAETTTPVLQKVPTDAVNELLTSDLTSNVASVAGTGEGTGAGEGEAFMFKMPTGGRAVTKGSFSAWTVPKDPEPEKDYKIVILIRLPKNVRSYRVADLSGSVKGTDGYTLQIPFDIDRPDHTLAEKRKDRLMPVRRTDRLIVRDNTVQIIVNVDGAATLVRDTIQVRSKLLKEEQKLEIVF